MNREQWLNAFAHRVGYSSGSVYMLPSFPSRAGRRVRLGDMTRDETGRYVLSVSPYLSQSAEVAVVAYWLLVRAGQSPRQRDLRRPNANERHALERAGFAAPFDAVVPTEALLTRLQATLDAHIAELGEYPAEQINPASRATVQSTRMLKAECNGGVGTEHDPYILRISMSQADRGMPYCGVCQSRMALA